MSAGNAEANDPPLVAPLPDVRQEPDEDALPDTSQDWAKLDGGAAFHLIERHADDWDDARRMMEAWRCARTDALDAEYAAPPQIAEGRDGVIEECARRIESEHYAGWFSTDRGSADDVKERIVAAIRALKTKP